MKLLYITPYFNPEIAASLYIFDNILEKIALSGNLVEIVVANPVRGIKDDIIKKYRNDKNLHEEILHNGSLLLHRVNTPLNAKGSLIKRALRYILMINRLYKRAKGIKPDVIFVSSTPPIIFLKMAGKIAKKSGAKVIYNVQDIFPESLESMGKLKKTNFLYRIFQKFDKSSYKHADHIITISQEFKNILINKKSVPEDKISIVMNWVEEDKVIPIAKENNSLYDLYNLDRNKFYITYCGNIGLSQSLETLLETAKMLKDNRDINFIILGEGANKADLKNKAIEMNLDNIILLPFQPYEKIAGVFSLGDAGLVISKKGTGKSSLPSKTWSIMSAEKPVIASFDEGELTRIIREATCGLCVEAENAEELKSAILNLYINRDGAAEMGKNGRTFVLNNLTKEIGTTKVYDIINNINLKKSME